MVRHTGICDLQGYPLFGVMRGYTTICVVLVSKNSYFNITLVQKDEFSDFDPDCPECFKKFCRNEN